MKEEIRKAIQEATPGPWEVVNLGNFNIAKSYRYENGKHIAKWIAEMCDDEDDEQQIANDAHLIANAPTWLQWQNNRIEQLEKALKDIAESDDDWYVSRISMKEYARQALKGGDNP